MVIHKEEGPTRQFSTGARKQAASGKGTPVLVPADAYMEVAKHFEEGAAIHGARNWEKGIPLSELLNSLERHIAAEKMGKTDERHDRAIAWNALVYLATKLRIYEGILPLSLDDMPKYPDPTADMPEGRPPDHNSHLTCGECLGQQQKRPGCMAWPAGSVADPSCFRPRILDDGTSDTSHTCGECGRFGITCIGEPQYSPRDIADPVCFVPKVPA